MAAPSGLSPLATALYLLLSRSTASSVSHMHDAWAVLGLKGRKDAERLSFRTPCLLLLRCSENVGSSNVYMS